MHVLNYSIVISICFLLLNARPSISSIPECNPSDARNAGVIFLTRTYHAIDGIIVEQSTTFTSTTYTVINGKVEVSYTTLQITGVFQDYGHWVCSGPTRAIIWTSNEYIYHHISGFLYYPCDVGTYRQTQFGECPLQCQNSPFKDNFEYTSAGNEMGVCQYSCKPGFEAVDNVTCGQCRPDYYRNGAMYVCIKCQEARTTMGCKTGTYPQLSPVDCSLLQCLPCTNKRDGEYYVSTVTFYNYMNLYPCYTSPCGSCFFEGYYRINCGTIGMETNPGTCVRCTKFEDYGIFDTAVSLYTNNLRYYYYPYTPRVECHLQSCTVCNIGYYNVDCPIPGGGTTPGNCNRCTSINTFTTEYIWPITRNVLGPDDCPFKCKKNYILSSGTCKKCRTSRACDPGYYTEAYYDSNGTCTDNVVCVQCTNNYITQGFRWDISLDSYGESACRYYCDIGYIHIANRWGCVPCEDLYKTCQTGHFLVARCVYALTNEEPYCSPCVGYNATFTGPGLVNNHSTHNATFTGPGLVNDHSSCPYECDDGYFKPDFPYDGCKKIDSYGTCNPGFSWGGGNKMRNNRCIPCPTTQMPNSIAYIDNVNTCAWTCNVGYELNYQAGICTRCTAGKYKASVGLDPCPLCPAGKYQAGTDVLQTCTDVIDNSRSNDDRRGYTCNNGYEMVQEFVIFECRSCNMNSNQLAVFSSLLYTQDTCIVSSFQCKTGFYRSVPPLSLPTTDYNAALCLPCPQVQINYSTGQWNMDQLSLLYATQRCGQYPSCVDPVDEINLACPISGCIPGTYIFNAKNSDNSITFNQSCAVCTDTNEICQGGYIRRLCQNGETKNPCTNCAANLKEGQTWNSVGSCVPVCKPGYYYYVATQPACQACTPGSYSTLTGTQTNCTQCSVGFYSVINGSTSCTACQPGTYSTKPTNCTSCAAGYYSSGYNSTQCNYCPNNTYSASSSQSSCLNCPDILPYSERGSYQCSLPPTPCPPGFYVMDSNVETICKVCTPGLFCVGGLEAPTICTLTAEKKVYSPVLAASKYNCSLESKFCYRLKNDNASFISCPRNTGTNGLTGARSILWCQANVGFFGFPGAVAAICPQDYSCPVGATKATRCPNATYSNEGSGNCSTIMRWPCRPGYYVINNVDDGKLNDECKPCPEASYCPGGAIAPTTIFSCGSSMNRWYSKPRSKSIDECMSEFSYNECYTATCPQYTTPPLDILGNPVCFQTILKCASIAGYYFIPGFHSKGIICPAGFYCPASTLVPIPCPPLSTSSFIGHIRETILCPAGVSTPRPEYIKCPSNIPSNSAYTEYNNCNYCCNTGYILTQSSQNVASCIVALNTSSCPQEFFMPVPDTSGCATSIQTCTACPQYSSLDIGLVTLSIALRQQWITSNKIASFGNSSCTPICKAGYYGNAQGCSPCPAGTYYDINTISLDTSFDTSCLTCPRGKYSPREGSTQCMTCGKWTTPAWDEVCINCQTKSSANPSLCKICNNWSIPLRGRINCTCIAGTYMLRNMMDDSITCEECPDGTHSSIQNPYTCVSCQVGSFCPPTTILSCMPGFYRENPYSHCLSCERGSISNTTDSKSCSQCQPGTYTNVNQTECKQCPPNTYSLGVGAMDNTSCNICPDSMISQSGSYKCVCGEGKYFDGSTCKTCKLCNANAATVASCPMGSTSDTTTCVCKDGYYGDGSTYCTLCTDPEACTCPATEYHRYTDINDAVNALGLT